MSPRHQGTQSEDLRAHLVLELLVAQAGAVDEPHALFELSLLPRLLGLLDGGGAGGDGLLLLVQLALLLISPALGLERGQLLLLLNLLAESFALQAGVSGGAETDGGRGKARRPPLYYKYRYLGLQKILAHLIHWQQRQVIGSFGWRASVRE